MEKSRSEAILLQEKHDVQMLLAQKDGNYEGSDHHMKQESSIRQLKEAYDILSKKHLGLLSVLEKAKSQQQKRKLEN